MRAGAAVFAVERAGFFASTAGSPTRAHRAAGERVGGQIPAAFVFVQDMLGHTRAEARVLPFADHRAWRRRAVPARDADRC